MADTTQTKQPNFLGTLREKVFLDRYVKKTESFLVISIENFPNVSVIVVAPEEA